jgi:hypothetical protein
MSKDIRIQVLLDASAYNYLLEYRAKRQINNTSKAVYMLVNEYRKAEVDLKTALDRLGGALAKKDKEIMELRHEIEHMKLKGKEAEKK